MAKANKNILSQELREHYHAHGVTGIESYIRQGQSQDQGLSTARRVKSTLNVSGEYGYGSGYGSRFIRLNPRYDKRETIDLLTNELSKQKQRRQKQQQQQQQQHTPQMNEIKDIITQQHEQFIAPIAVPWISPQLDFYAIPNDFQLSQSNVFREGRVYGMDVSSGAAIDALLLNDHDVHNNDTDVNARTLEKEQDRDVDVDIDVEAGTQGVGDLEYDNNDNDDDAFRVLDLCCAPGLKTCAIADLLYKPQNNELQNHHHSKKVIIVGVDNSEKRIRLCRNIVRKYHIDPETSGTGTGVQGCEEQDDKSKNDPEALLNIQGQGKHHAATDEGAKMTIQLYHTDGTTFGTLEKRSADGASLIFDSNVALEQQRFAGKRKRMNRSAKARERKRLKSIGSLAFEGRDSGGSEGENTHHEHDSVILPLFDRVLVDAECSTDGAVRHMQCKYNQLIGENMQEGPMKTNSNATAADQQTSELRKLTTNSKLTDARQLEDLVALQRKLIASGFRLLKRGGILVYSTCSLAREQNEDVVSWLIEQNADDAYIVPVSFSHQSNTGQEVGGEVKRSTRDIDDRRKKSHISASVTNQNPSSMITEGLVKGSVRFHPATLSSNALSSDSSIMYGGGFFMTKIRKKK